MKAGSAPDLIITTETSGGAGARSPQPPLDDEVAERTPFRVVSVDGGVRLERCDRALSYRDLHRLVGKAAAATPDPDPACQREANEANLEALYYEREDETDSLGLYRILRRKACIVLSFPIAGALIYSDPSSADGVSVLLLLPDTAALLAAVESDLNARPSLGLDLRALTAVLNLLFRHFRSRVREPGAAAEQGAGSIEALIGVLHSLNEVVSGAQAALKCLAKLEEDDRAPLCLLPPDAKGRQANALEELLEHTTDLIEVSRDRAQWLTEKVEADITTQHEKAAGSERGLQNRLTQFQLRINLVTMVFAMCSMISGCACLPRAAAARAAAAATFPSHAPPPSLTLLPPACSLWHELVQWVVRPRGMPGAGHAGLWQGWLCRGYLLLPHYVHPSHTGLLLF